MTRKDKNLQDDILNQVALVRIVRVIMQSTAFLSERSAFYDQVSYGYHIPKFQQLRRQSTGLIQLFGFFPKEIDTPQRTLQSHVIANNTDVITHHQLQFLQTLRDQDHFFGFRCSSRIPVRYVLRRSCEIELICGIDKTPV